MAKQAKNRITRRKARTPTPSRPKPPVKRDSHAREKALIWIAAILIALVAIAVMAYYLPRVTLYFWQALSWNLPLFFLLPGIGILLAHRLKVQRTRWLVGYSMFCLLVLLLVGAITRGWWMLTLFLVLGWSIYLIIVLLVLGLAASIFWPLVQDWWKHLLAKRISVEEKKAMVQETATRSRPTDPVEKKRLLPEVATPKPIPLQQKPSPSPPPKGKVTAPTATANYQLPPLDFLQKPVVDGARATRRETRNAAQQLEEKLKSFGIGVKVVNVQIGPSVTRYELDLDPGVTVSKILTRQDDLALHFAAPGVMIETPVPGKSFVGIEIPSERIALVPLREIIDSSEFSDRKFRIPLTLGKDISGKPIITELREMPHLLVAGTTGSGKSMCINCMLCGMLYHATPEEIRLILIDPKRVELYNYQQLPHLLYPVVTDAKQAAAVLKEIVSDMEQRLVQFSELGARDIEAYNQKVRDSGLNRPIPYYVVVIDEFADLMMVARADVEKYIIRLAQLARATGIHLILATQRPSTDVITGIIKANAPSRIAFKVSSKIESYVVLDRTGAEKLLGKGDLLFFPTHYPKPVRLQGAYVTEGEITKIVHFWREQGQGPDLRNLPVYREEDERGAGDEESDTLYEEALQIVLQAGEGSASMLQRKMKIGYARAGRLIDLMERKGLLGPAIGSKPRPLLRHPEQSSLKFP